MRTKEGYVDRFQREARDAEDEFRRLTDLFKDVCWYNFETQCRDWQRPWRRSDPESVIELHSHIYERFWNRRHLREVGRYPYYYHGEVQDAPKLPPQIVLVELKAASEHLAACRENIAASHDWAPGGKKYEALRRSTLVGRGQGKRKFSSGTVAEGDDCDTPFAGISV